MGLSKALPLSRFFNPTRGQALAAILILWTLVNTFLLTKGIVTTGEAVKYISQAQYLLANGRLETSNFDYYSLIIFLLAFCFKFHLGLGWVVAIQMLFNLAAVLYFFDTMCRIFRSEKTAFIAALLLLLNIPYQSFNTAMQTESLFQSLSLLLTCYLLRHEILRVKQFIGILLFIFLLSLSRPLGLLFIPAAFLYFYLTTLRQTGWQKQTAFWGITILGFLYVLNRAMGSGGEYDFMLPFREEHIICGAPTLLQPLSFSIAGSGNALYDLIYYIFHHPGQFLRLATLKTISLWGIYRSYYSAAHNAVLLLFFYPIMLIALLSLRSWKRHYPFKMVYLLTIILVTWVTVVLTCDDWSNRVFISITPYLIILAAGYRIKYILP